MKQVYEFDAVIHEVPDNGGAYVIFPWNIREEFGKGRVKVYAEFDSIPYNGSIVNMGVKDEDGNVCYVIGLLKAIRKQLNKGDGDAASVERIQDVRDWNESAGIFFAGSEWRNEKPCRLSGSESDLVFLSEGYDSRLHQASLCVWRAVSAVSGERSGRSRREQGQCGIA